MTTTEKARMTKVASYILPVIRRTPGVERIGHLAFAESKSRANVAFVYRHHDRADWTTMIVRYENKDRDIFSGLTDIDIDFHFDKFRMTNMTIMPTSESFGHALKQVERSVPMMDENFPIAMAIATMFNDKTEITYSTKSERKSALDLVDDMLGGMGC